MVFNYFTLDCGGLEQTMGPRPSLTTDFDKLESLARVQGVQLKEKNKSKTKLLCLKSFAGM